MSKPLYEQDFFRWTEQQARELRAASAFHIDAPLDWANLAEEIESLGRSDRRELASRIQTIIEHLMKLQASTATDPRRGWKATVRRERIAVRRLLRDSRSLRGAAADMIVESVADARSVVEDELGAYGGSPAMLPSLDYTEHQVLGDWLPD